jgi:hypothetical protein
MYTFVNLPSNKKERAAGIPTALFMAAVYRNLFLYHYFFSYNSVVSVDQDTVSA